MASDIRVKALGKELLPKEELHMLMVTVEVVNHEQLNHTSLRNIGRKAKCL